MKFSDYFLAPGVRPLSVLLGVMLGGIASLFAGWKYGVLIGAAAAIVFSVLIPFVVYREDLPYTRIKKTLAQPFLFDEHVRFTVREGTVGGYFILTEGSMIFLSLEKGNHRLELTREDVRNVTLGEDYSISIYLTDTHFIRVISTVCEEMFNVLRENGWL